MSDYNCEIEHGDDWIAVRRAAGTCRFRIDLPGDLALLDAGDRAEYVVSGDFVEVPPGLNNARLEGYTGYALSGAPDSRS
jgi:hypothetical protein